MASTRETSHLADTLKVDHVDFDPDSADVTDVKWYDLTSDTFNSFLFTFFRTVGTGDVDTFRIACNSAADGSGTDAVVKTKTISSQPDAVGDYIILEVSADEIQQAATDGSITPLGLSAQVEFATATDEGVVTAVMGRAHNPGEGLTADTISA